MHYAFKFATRFGESLFLRLGPCRAREELTHLLVARLREIFVVLADRLEVFRRARTDNFVGNIFELTTRVWGSNRDRDYDFRRASFSQGFDRGTHRRSRRESVVNQDNYLA